MLNEDLAKDLTLEEFRRFRDLLHKHSGIYLEESKLDSLRISLVTRATRLGYTSLSEYYKALARDDHEFNELLNLVTINETSFFRFPAQFAALRNNVLPEIMASRAGGNRVMRIWSAGCSTGEEPYSIAMTVMDSGIEVAGYTPQILGTDVSTKALARAKAGVYGTRAMLNVPDDVVSRYFEATPNGDHRVTDRVRKYVDFGYQNLIREPYPLSLMGNWDIIFCRNVTIYFRLESTRRVVQNFYDSLNEGGYLFIGHSETLTSVSDTFEAVEIGGVFLYRKPPSRKFFNFAQAAPAARASRGATPPATAAAPRSKVVREPRKPVEPQPAEVAADPLEQARADLKEGHPERVLEIVNQVLEVDPNNADAHLLFGYVHADAGDYDEAMRASHRALAINPLLPAARYILGIIYQRQGDAIRAVSELKKTLYIDADFAIAHLNLANIYKAQRKWDAAAKEYENALKSLKKSPNGQWTEYSGGFQADLLVRTCERSLIECRRAIGGK
ncbi:MAG: tetratricopeptide repeat protein [Actinobacteria bacterium]|nr:tetratricopeptide repeat protein [Actinomycetota bacterium]